VADPKTEIDQLYQSLERLRVEFDRFFRKERKFPPIQERNALEAALRRMGSRPMVSTGDQFRFTGLQCRYTAMATLWERQLRDLEEGRGAALRSAAAPAASTFPAAPSAEAIAAERLEAAVDGWKTARAECGAPANDAEAAAFREMLRRKAAEIAGAGGGTVEFSVSVEGGRPKIRAAVRRDG
jgi:hypothetical protein